jgi:hypothetical protein
LSCMLLILFGEEMDTKEKTNFCEIKTENNDERMLCYLR